MRKNIFLLFFFLLTINSFGQRLLQITVSIGEEEKHAAFLSRRGTDYVSAKDLADILSGNYYYNDQSNKIDIKFDDYKLKITARNQFYVLTDKSTNNQKIFQIPISTMYIDEDVFIPLNYSLNILSTAFGYQLHYNPDVKHLKVIYDKTIQPEITYEKKSTNEPVPKKREKIIPNTKYDIYGIQVKELANGTLVNLETKKRINTISKPTILNNTLLLTISGALIDPAIEKQFKSSGLVKSFNLKKVNWKNYQLEFKLNKGYSKAVTSYNSVGDLQISIHNKIFEKPNSEANGKSKWELDVIVIDAGHGGKDAGAIGVRGTYEKNINLKLALKLGNMLENHFKDKVKVVYTRKTDKFVELYKRGKIANENDGKLFISIHCNSLNKKPSSPRGFEVYLLRPGRTKEAINIAEKENSVIELEENPDRYEKLNDENFILVSMAHSAYMRYSEKFSEKLDQQMRKYVNIPSRGVKQAGFFVLVGASMPGILFEAGFLSNKLDEAYLRSSSGQNELAQGLMRAVIEYKKYYDKFFEYE